MTKDKCIEILDQAHLDIMDVILLMDEMRHFHVSGELQACSLLMSQIIRKVQKSPV